MINISVLNSNLECVAIIDRYKSFIWTERYYEPGEFELCLPVTSKYAQDIQKDMFLTIKTSKRAMVVESIKIESDNEDGNYYLISGRSLESILDRRIVWKQTVVDGKIQDAIHRLIDEAFIGAETWEGSTYKFDPRRRISNFVFANNSAIDVSYVEKAQYMGDSILDIVTKVCKAYHVGFKIELVNNYFVFTMIKGKDRTHDQNDNNYVVFSPSLDNLLSSNYLESIKNYKNVLRIAGEGEGATQTFITHYIEFDDVNASEMVGFKRREIYVDCHDVSSVTSGNVTMDVQQYTNTLVQKGVEKLVDLVPETAFEGEIDATIQYEYGNDTNGYNIGDICEINNEYGISDNVRVTEVVRTWEADGYTCIPTLESISKEKDPTASGSGSSTTETIIETIESVYLDDDSDCLLKVKWKDPYGSSEEASIAYLTHENVRMDTQLMSIWYEPFVDNIGQYGEGNIDLYDRPIYHNPDGTISTVESVSFEDNGEWVLCTTIIFDEHGDPAKLTEQQAYDYYYNTGEYLGKFETFDECEVYAVRLHEQQEWYYAEEAGSEQFWYGKWNVKIRKSNTSVLDKNEETTVVYQSGMTFSWVYYNEVDYEASYTT